jgi:hypothetical protein
VDGIQLRNSASVGAAAGNRASDHMLKALLASVIPACGTALEQNKNPIDVRRMNFVENGI